MPCSSDVQHPWKTVVESVVWGDGATLAWSAPGLERNVVSLVWVLVDNARTRNTDQHACML